MPFTFPTKNGEKTGDFDACVKSNQDRDSPGGFCKFLEESQSNGASLKQSVAAYDSMTKAGIAIVTQDQVLRPPPEKERAKFKKRLREKGGIFANMTDEDLDEVIDKFGQLPEGGPGLRAKQKSTLCDPDSEDCGGKFAGASVIKTFDNGNELFKKNGKKYFKVFLVNTSFNANKWRVTAEALRRDLKTFVGMPYVDDKGNNPENDGKRRHFGAEFMSLPEILEKQEDLKEGTIVDVEFNPQTMEGYAVVEVNDAIFQELQNGEGIYVSPGLTGMPMVTREGLVYDSFFGLHLARVDDPAFGVMKAAIKETCEGSERECVMRLTTSAASLGISFNPLGLTKCQIQKMAENNDSKKPVKEEGVTVKGATEEDQKKIDEMKKEMAKLQKAADDAISEKDKIEQKEKQTSQTAAELQSKVAQLEEKDKKREDDEKKDIATKIAQMEEEDEVRKKEESEAAIANYMKMSLSSLEEKLASVETYHTKLASMKEGQPGLSSKPGKTVRMAGTTSSIAAKKEKGESLDLETVSSVMP